MTQKTENEHTLYEDMLADDIAAGSAERLDEKFIEWGEIGQRVVGVYVGADERVSQKNDGTYLAHTIDVGGKRVQVICGHLVDSALTKTDVRGRLIELVFQGVRDLGGGKRLNQFTITVGRRVVKN